MEQRKYVIIKRLVETNGNKKRAAATLGVTPRHVNRLIKIYLEFKKVGFSHGNKGKIPSNKISAETRNEIRMLYDTTYDGLNFRHFNEKLKQNEGIDISYFVVYKILTENNNTSPMAQRKTKKRAKQELSEQLKKPKDTPGFIAAKAKPRNIQSPITSHASKPRKKYAGELLQMDASQHIWFGNYKTYLHAAIDDASGRLVGLYFMPQETLLGYYHVLRQCLLTYGIPYEILTDCRSVFEHKRYKNGDYETTITQFGYACEQLGISLKSSSVPEEKGRIERVFGTLQSRLISELRIRNINNIDDANTFLETFIHEFNDRFQVPNGNSLSHIYEELTSDIDLNTLLSTVAIRTIDNGATLSYSNKKFQAYDSNGSLVNFINKTKVVVLKAFSGELFCLSNSVYYKLIELPRHHEISQEFDHKPPKERKKYTVPRSHPWSEASFLEMLARKGL